ncbi:hypothetical protein DS62_09590 [Smithella sp. SC_K08D17]|jgi:Fe-S-cluster-containing hydrogenase component 2|nr:hypothetical protein KD27_00750 [Smithella sp. D17]KIE17864.1 hypothetical protein DS62_09590 [Smithella sp. SC_K08D17]
MKAIEMKDDVAFVNTKECIGCGLCVTGCPAEAIKLVERKQIPSIPATVREMGAKVLQEKGRLDAFQQNGHTMACPIGNLSLELAGTNERLRAFRSYLTGYFENIKA